MLMLDTHVVIALLNGKPVSVRQHFKSANDSGSTIAISSVVVFELRYGVAKSARRTMNEDRLADFLSGPIEVMGFEDEDAAVAGDIRAKLEAAGTPIGPYDVMIAGHALRHGATVVTANVDEFRRVGGLTVENWV